MRAGPTRLVSIGRLVEQKGQLLLIDALARAARDADIHMTLVGDGELRGAIEAAIAARGLGARVTLTGWVDESRVRAELAAEGLALLDVLVCTSADDAHPDRKPNPGMLRAAAERHHLDLSKSWMIGDRESDVQTGRNAGVAVTVLVDDGSAPTAATHRVPDMPACAALLRQKL